MEPQVSSDTGRDTSRAPEDVLLLEARQQGLLTLISELLRQNEELRMKVARLEAQTPAARA